MSLALPVPAAATPDLATTRAASRPPKSERLAFIDALRGLAALAVAAYHIERYGPLAEPASRLIAGPIEEVIRRGWMGVQTFYVISGFVIAYSLRDAWMTPAYLGNYALRRSLRLDPPYWATIAASLAVFFLAPVFAWPSPMLSEPSWPQFGWHFLYLQNLMGYDNLSVGLWTLCIEVQFYLLYAIAFGLAQRTCGAARWNAGGGGAALSLWFMPIAVVSLLTYRHDEFFAGPLFACLAPFQNDACMLHYFWMFFLGMLVHWALERRLPAALLFGYLGLMAVRFGWREVYESSRTGLVHYSWSIEVAVAAIAGTAIYLVGRAGRMATAGNWRPLQFLGLISYSLYLIHYPVSHVIVHLAQAWAEKQPWYGTAVYGWFALGVTALSLAAAIVVGYGMYLLVERPSVRLAARFRRKEQVVAA